MVISSPSAGGANGAGDCAGVGLPPRPAPGVEGVRVPAGVPPRRGGPGRTRRSAGPPRPLLWGGPGGADLSADFTGRGGSWMNPILSPTRGGGGGDGGAGGSTGGGSGSTEMSEPDSTADSTASAGACAAGSIRSTGGGVAVVSAGCDVTISTWAAGAESLSMEGGAGISTGAGAIGAGGGAGASSAGAGGSGCAAGRTASGGGAEGNSAAGGGGAAGARSASGGVGKGSTAAGSAGGAGRSAGGGGGGAGLTRVALICSSRYSAVILSRVLEGTLA